MAQTDVQISIEGSNATVSVSELPFQTGDGVTFTADEHGATLLASEEVAAILSPSPDLETDIAPYGAVSFTFLSASAGQYVVGVQPPGCPVPAILDGSSSGRGSSILEIIPRKGRDSGPDPIVVDPPLN